MATTVLIVIDDDDGSTTATCSCGRDLGSSDAHGAGSLIRTTVPSHVGLHASANHMGVPWADVEQILKDRMRRAGGAFGG